MSQKTDSWPLLHYEHLALHHEPEIDFDWPMYEDDEITNRLTKSFTLTDGTFKCQDSNVCSVEQPGSKDHIG